MINLEKYNPKNIKDWHGKIFLKGDLVLITFKNTYSYKDKRLPKQESTEIVICEPFMWNGAVQLIQSDKDGYLTFSANATLNNYCKSIRNRKIVDIKIIERNAARK